MSSALFWVKEYHIDGLRGRCGLNAVPDYNRKDGEWIRIRTAARKI